MTAPAVTSVRAGDHDRERTATQLGQALSQGYLVFDEYESRVQATFAAHTTGELRQLVADLPLAQLRRNDPQRRAARRRAARAFAHDCRYVQTGRSFDRTAPVDQRHRALGRDSRHADHFAAR